MTEAPLQTHRLKESVAPVLSVLTECARMHRPARKFLKAQVWGLGARMEPWSDPSRSRPRLRDDCLPGAAPTAGREDSA